MEFASIVHGRSFGLAIQGGESGKTPRKFDVAWVQSLYEQCQATGTPYFLKQLGAVVYRRDDRVQLRDRHGSDWNEWPADVPRVRQMPAPDGEALAATRACDGHFCDGNRKLGKGTILSYDLSPVLACPGSRLALCRELRPDGNAIPKPICWACRGCYREHGKKGRLARNYCFSQTAQFVPWATAAINARRNSIRAVRIPGTGDFYSVQFVAKVRAIVQAHPDVRFWAYTRSWTIPSIWTQLRQLGAEPNVVLWQSWDRKLTEHHGAPPACDLPSCWLAETDDDLPPEQVDLVFRYMDQSHRDMPYVPILGGAAVCPHEDGRTDTTCAQCGICWRGNEFRTARIERLLRQHGGQQTAVGIVASEYSMNLGNRQANA